MPESLICVESLLRIYSQQLTQEVFCLCADLLIRCVYRAQWLGFLDLPGELLSVLTLERQVTRQNSVHYDTCGPNVRFSSTVLPSWLRDKLRCHVLGCAAELLQVFFAARSEPKVNNFDLLSSLIIHYIVKFDITMTYL